jgi:hypothetical protein
VAFRDPDAGAFASAALSIRGLKSTWGRANRLGRPSGTFLAAAEPAHARKAALAAASQIRIGTGLNSVVFSMALPFRRDHAS